MNINENKIYHLTEMEEFFGADEWKLQIDVTDIWNQVSSGAITFEQFNQQYAQRLNKYKNEILQLGNDVWNKVADYINEVNTKKTKEESMSVYESIYDWADEFDILIKTK